MFLSTLLILLYLFAITQAVKFFRMPGETRDDDKTIAASIIAASVMFVAARVITFFYYIPANEVSGYPVELWLAFGFFNGMFYLGYLHRLIECKRNSEQRRQQPIKNNPCHSHGDTL